MGSSLHHTVAIGLLLAAALGPGAAFAQGADPQRAAAAQTIYQQATADMDKKDYAAACKKLQEVVKLVPDALGAKMTLGECYEGLVKNASAWAQYTIVADLAPKQGQAERAKKASAKVNELRSKLATLTLVVPASVRSMAGVVIMRDSDAVGEVQWGVPLPVDAGGHEVVVSAPGHKPWKQHVEIIADGVKVTLAVQAPVPEPRVTAGPSASANLERTWQRPLAIGAIGVGAAGLIVGAALGGLAISKNNTSKQDGHCDAKDTCDPEGLSLRNTALDFGNGSTAAIVVGGVLSAAGLVLFLTAPSKPAAERAARPRLRFQTAVEIGVNGVRVKGAW